MTDQTPQPCPFCGGTASLGIVTEGGEANPDFGGHFVQCNNERCHGCMGLRFACGDDPRPALLDAWNQRTPSPHLAEIAALRAERDAMAAAMQEFVTRVDAGEVRSKRTYAKFKALLALTTGGQTDA